MMENLRPEKKVIKDVRTPFQIRKTKRETIDNAIKDRDIRNLFKLEKENKKIKDRIIRDTINVFRLEKKIKGMKEIIISNIRNLFEHEEKGFNKPLIINNFQSNNHISKGKKVKKIKKYKRKGDRKTLSFGENLNTISSYLKDIRNDLKKFGK